jgi:hypothetical protein
MDVTFSARSPPAETSYQHMAACVTRAALNLDQAARLIELCGKDYIRSTPAQEADYVCPSGGAVHEFLSHGTNLAVVELETEAEGASRRLFPPPQGALRTGCL